MCKASTTSPRPSSKCSCPHTSVGYSPARGRGCVPLTCEAHTPDADPEDIDPSILPTPVIAAVEADSFWCLSRLLDGIQDNYISAQPGIQRSVKRMAELVARIDAPLSEHLAAQGVEFMQFAFRWMNCLLMREISVKNTVRMWDTYLVRLFSLSIMYGGHIDCSWYEWQAEGTDAFSQFHLYVCSAFLVRWSDKLREMDFQVHHVYNLSLSPVLR